MTRLIADLDDDQPPVNAVTLSDSNVVEEHYLMRLAHSIQCLASAFRTKEYYEPRFHITPTHYALYVGEHDDFATLSHVGDIPANVIDDFFTELPPSRHHDYFLVEINKITGGARYVPKLGPAPIWTHPTAALTLSRSEMIKLVQTFVEELF